MNPDGTIAVVVMNRTELPFKFMPARRALDGADRRAAAVDRDVFDRRVSAVRPWLEALH